MAGRHDPQLVLAFSETPTSSNVVSDSDVIAEMMVFMPTSKQTQTIGPRSGAGLAGRPASRASGDVSSRSEEHKSELQSLMRISYAVFCLKKKQTDINSNLTTLVTHSSITPYVLVI